MYHYAGNNPVHYIDPDGREVDISGDPNQNLILQALSQLTDDTLIVSNGKINIEKYGEGQKESGTQLLRYLIEETDKTIKISTTEPEGNNNSLTVPYKFNDDSTEYDALNSDAINIFSKVFKMQISKTIVIKYDHNIDLSEFNEGEIFLVRDTNDDLYVVRYVLEGEYLETELEAKAVEDAMNNIRIVNKYGSKKV